MNIEVRTLRWYIAVAEELHFARAAKKLNIARTRLSRAVIDLEEELGYRVFVPGESPTRLTDEGAAFLDTARTLVAEDENRRREEAAEQQAKASALTVGYAEGVTPAKWARIWGERFPDVELRLAQSELATQVSDLHDGSADVGFVRLPVDRDGLSVIELYEEVPVAVVPKDHPIAAYDRVPVSDLADEHLLQEPDMVPEWAAIATEIADGARVPLPPISSNVELIQYVAAGLGIAVVPQSIARLYARKDLVYRPVDGVAGSRVAVAWPAGETTNNVEEFVGIVRGRSVRSSRGTTPSVPAKKRAAAPSRSSAQNRPAKKTPPRGRKPKRS